MQETEWSYRDYCCLSPSQTVQVRYGSRFETVWDISKHIQNISSDTGDFEGFLWRVWKYPCFVRYKSRGDRYPNRVYGRPSWRRSRNQWSYIISCNWPRGRISV